MQGQFNSHRARGNFMGFLSGTVANGSGPAADTLHTMHDDSGLYSSVDISNNGSGTHE